MRYAELPLPPALHGHVAALWTASVPDDGHTWIEREAVPDGCIELIARSSGRSVWRREQPPLFATGLATTTAKLRLGAGSSFTGLKLWPWTWHMLGGAPCRTLTDDWIAIASTSPLAALIEGPPEVIVARLAEMLRSSAPPALGAALLEETTVAAVACRVELSHRQLQRLFARDFGMPPRSYLRLLRFRGALTGVQVHPNLADAAAAQGYADQAHMSREFRALAGLAPSAVRARARGPFVTAGQPPD
jgi:AraC-like DNA-binding protein